MTRGAKITLLTASAFLACVYARGEGSDSPTSWTVFRLNPQLNAVVASDSGVEPRWQFKTKGGISSSPTIAGSAVFVASNDGTVYSLNVLTGTLRWSFAADNMVMTAPLVDDGVVVVGEGNYEQIDWQPGHEMLVGTGSNALWGLNESDGAVFWRVGLTGTGMPTGVILDGKYVHHDGAGMIVAADLLDGTFAWRADVRSANAMAAMNVVGAHVVVTAGYEPDSIFAFDTQTRRIVWRYLLPKLSAGQGDCPLAVDGGVVFGMYLTAVGPVHPLHVGDDVQQVTVALDGAGGTLLWEQKTGRGALPPRNRAGIPLVYSGSVYEGSAVERVVTAMDEHSGRVRWRFHPEGTVKGGLSAENGVIYFADSAGYIWAISADSGSVLGDKMMADSFGVGSPVIVGKSLIIGSANGWVYAVPLADILSSRSSRQ